MLGAQRYPGKGFIQDSGLTSSSISINDGQRFVNTISVTAPAGQLLLSRIYRTIWLGSRTGDNWFPYGNNVDMTKYQYYVQDGPVYFYDTGTGNLSPMEANQDQSQLFIRNGSGSSQTFVIDADVRYMMNSGGIGALS